jgi:hypothetical protein
MRELVYYGLDGGDWMQAFFSHPFVVAAEQRVVDEYAEPDDRLDDLGWEIFRIAATMGADRRTAAVQAMDGNLRQRKRVLRDLRQRQARWAEHIWRDIGREAIEDAAAPEQLDYWRPRLTTPNFVYFVQEGDRGPVKIGRAVDPERRVRDLQTGNPTQLELRHVLPGASDLEGALHRRFEPALIRGEWYGRKYLPVILAFGEGLARDAVEAYDGSGVPPLLVLDGLGFRGQREVGALRTEIDRLRRDGHTRENMATWLHLPIEEVEFHLEALAGERLRAKRAAGLVNALYATSHLRERYRDVESPMSGAA